jgi:alpha-glucosidase
VRVTYATYARKNVVALNDTPYYHPKLLHAFRVFSPSMAVAPEIAPCIWDGCRTPMPWDDGVYAGFTTGEPWLPVADQHRSLNVARQHRDAYSTLNRFRSFLRWRKEQPVLLRGDIRIVPTREPVFAFERRMDADCMFLAFNLSGETVEFELPALRDYRQIEGIGLLSGELMGASLRIPAHGVVFARPR